MSSTTRDSVKRRVPFVAVRAARASFVCDPIPTGAEPVKELTPTEWPMAIHVEEPQPEVGADEVTHLFGALGVPPMPEGDDGLRTSDGL